MSKVVKAVIISLIALIIGGTALFFIYYWTSFKAADNAFANVVNEGNDYMDKESYDSAISKYEKALEMEPENTDLRNALAHAYVCYATTMDDEDSAINAYQNALMYNGSNTNAFWGIIDIYDSRGDEDSVLDTLKSGYEATGDENMKIKADNIEAERARIIAEEEAAAAEEAERIALEESRNAMLLPVKELFEADPIDYDAIKDLIRTEEYAAFADEVISDDNCFYLGDRDDSGNKSGKGLAIYANGYYYYGDFANDVREGNGIYMRAVYTINSALGSFIYEGEFSNDKPNGHGVATSNYYKDRISAAELVKSVIEGNFKDGYEDGEMSLEGTKRGGGNVKYTYKVVDGVAEKSSDDNSGIEGQYIIAKSKDGKSNLTSDGSKRGIEGFISE